MIALLLALAVPLDPGLFDAVTGYRIAQYRGVVSSPPPHVQRIGDVEAAALRDANHALFIDVTPAAGAQHDPTTGAWQLAEAHQTIPGAHWFPDAGRGSFDPAINQWFSQGLARLVKASSRHTIVVFCLADCWMSWNASWKIKRLGYRDVRWYANGSDGWRDMNRSLTPATPEAWTLTLEK